MPGESPATDFSVALLAEFVRVGVRDVVLSPGSRSQAIALAAAEYEAAGVIRLHVRIDERVAGFLALGLALESGAPAVVVTTSGTAVANLHPAVMEAFEARVPMIVVTAQYRGERGGCLVGFHTQCSIEPPRYAVWLSKANHTTRVALQATHLAVHFLGPDDHDLAALFGEQTGDDVDKFSQCESASGPCDVPVLTAWT